MFIPSSSAGQTPGTPSGAGRRVFGVVEELNPGPRGSHPYYRMVNKKQRREVV